MRTGKRADINKGTTKGGMKVHPHLECVNNKLMILFVVTNSRELASVSLGSNSCGDIVHHFLETDIMFGLACL